MDTNTTTGFTVDLSAITNVNTVIDLMQAHTSDTDRAHRIQLRVDELIKPGIVYRITEANGDLLGTIGAECAELNVDEELHPIQEMYSEVLDIETRAEIAEFMFAMDVMEKILDRIDHPNEEISPWSRKTNLEVQRDWVAEQHTNEAQALADADDTEREQAAEAMSCNGWFDRVEGEIKHHPGSYCPIHFSN